MSLVQSAASILAQVSVNNGGGGIFAAIPCFLVPVIGLAGLALFIWALVDAIQNPRLDGNQRLIWVIVILVLPLLGPILYLVIGRNA